MYFGEDLTNICFGLYVQIFKEFISSICIYMLLIALVQVHTIMLSEKLVQPIPYKLSRLKHEFLTIIRKVNVSQHLQL